MPGCDTFVVLPPKSAENCVLFAKNSDRPNGEVQEIVYLPKRDSSGGKLKTTYIEVNDSQCHAVILSKPSWMWGAEMGANELGVVCGNEAVDSKVNLNKSPDCLTGMDLVRLCLERAGSASEGVDVITSLLAEYGQGGPCSEDGSLSYHNSFMIADCKEAWIVETAGKQWAAMCIKDGYFNISNCFKISTKIDRMSDDLKSYAIDNKFWDGEGEFDFAACYGNGCCDRDKAGEKLLERESSDGPIEVDKMFNILRDKESGICFPKDGAFQTASSQVSVIRNDGKPNFHWFTGTPDPSISVFKPFAFTPNSKISQHTISPQGAEDRRHTLYKAWEIGSSKPEVLTKLRSMEAECVSEVKQFCGAPDLAELEELLKDIVETEVKFYK